MFKYNEKEVLQEVIEYIGSTYENHHYSEGGIEPIDLIVAKGWGIPFCLSSVLKYAGRGTFKGSLILDLKKIIHYATIALYLESLREKIDEEKSKV